MQEDPENISPCLCKSSGAFKSLNQYANVARAAADCQTVTDAVRETGVSWHDGGPIE